MKLIAVLLIMISGYFYLNPPRDGVLLGLKAQSTAGCVAAYCLHGKADLVPVNNKPDGKVPPPDGSKPKPVNPKNKPVIKVVVLTAEFCPPCKLQKEAMKKEMTDGWKFGAGDDCHIEFQEPKFSVIVPQTIFFKGSTELYRFRGYVSPTKIAEKYNELIDQNKAKMALEPEKVGDSE